MPVAFDLGFGRGHVAIAHASHDTAGGFRLGSEPGGGLRCVGFCSFSRAMLVNTQSHTQTASFLWSVADLLRGDFKQSQYGRVILPFTLLRRMECVLAPSKAQVLAAATEHQTKTDEVRERLLLRAAGQP